VTVWLTGLVYYSFVTVITQEKTIHGIEVFDKSKLKHAETAEKVVLPEQQGKLNFVD